MFEKLIGISFISLASDILLSGSSFKKYVKAVIGGIFVLTLVSGIANMGDIEIEIPGSAENDIAAEENREIFMEKLNSEVVLNTEREIKDKLLKEGIGIKSITVDFFEDYRIKKIEISLENYSKDNQKAIELLVNYFEIDYEVISLC